MSCKNRVGTAHSQLSGGGLEAEASSSSEASPSHGIDGSTDGDYGFAPSWPPILLPTVVPSEGVVGARHDPDVHEVERVLRPAGGDAAAGVRGSDVQHHHHDHHGDPRLHLPGSQDHVAPPLPPSSSSPQQQEQEQQGLLSGHYPGAAAAAAAIASTDNSISTNSYADMETSSATAAAGAAAETFRLSASAAGPSTSSDGEPSGEAATGSAPVTSSPHLNAQRCAAREQVSLPEDIYGAARVSEYWHGMHALSSLASSYVYDDIWAGDGGLNPR